MKKSDRPTHSARPRCTPTQNEAQSSVSLPVIGDEPGRTRIRASKNAPRRAFVLGLIQLLIILHIIQWWITGRTTTPIEPSEAMEFTRQGVVNFGLIFFAVALLSTLILGRWFCGWGCHLVLLQDLCAWMMKKIGVKPKPFRSRFLIYVPFIVAVYMFLMPAVHRWGMIPLDATLVSWLHEEHIVVRSARASTAAIGFPMNPPQPLPGWQVQPHLTTEDFWRTFPGLMVAVPFLLICGFACVYFLGAKGFCTYGCPYGGFFAPLDRYAPGRIRVTDDCEQCGHCTAVCTSNVRVHDEVREYGMIVDPGCMKCFDCVSVCPKNALYFGFGRPAAGNRKAKHAPPPRRYDLTLREEFAFAGVFLVSFLAYRGLYNIIPMLMAIGMAGVTTFVLWKLWRMVRDRNVTMHRYRFRIHGRTTRPGMAFAAFATLVLVFTVHSGIVHTTQNVAAHFDDRVTTPLLAAFAPEAHRQVPEEEKEYAAKSLAWYDLTSALGPGTIGLGGGWQSEIDSRRAWLYGVKGEFDMARRYIERVAGRHGMSDQHALGLVLIDRAQGREDEAYEQAMAWLLEYRDFHNLLQHFVQWSDDLGRRADAVELCRDRLERFEDDVATLHWLAMLMLDMRRADEGIALLGRAVEIEPENVGLRSTYSMALATFGRVPEAIEQMRRGIELQPNNPQMNLHMASLLEAVGRRDEALQYRQRAEAMAPPLAEEHFDSPLVR